MHAFIHFFTEDELEYTFPLPHENIDHSDTLLGSTHYHYN